MGGLWLEWLFIYCCIFICYLYTIVLTEATRNKDIYIYVLLQTSDLNESSVNMLVGYNLLFQYSCLPLE
jgi:hypothetical protein